jgi:hypothetical protein
MLSELFYWVLNMSILGGLVGLLVAGLSKILKFPKFAAYLLWLLVLIRLWVPFGVDSRWSLLQLISKYTTKTVSIWGNDANALDFTMPTA